MALVLDAVKSQYKTVGACGRCALDRCVHSQFWETVSAAKQDAAQDGACGGVHLTGLGIAELGDMDMS